MDIEAFLEEHAKEDKNSLNYLIAEHFIKRGMEKGIPEGVAKGEAIGRAAGEAIGRVQGEAIGRAQGEAIGRSQGEAIGRAQGEAIGRAQGEAIGKTEGLRRTLKLQLEVRFGPLPARSRQAIEHARPTQLERLAIALLDAESLEGALHAAGLRS